MILKEYQKKAVKDLLSNTAKILNENRDDCQSLVFKAPTWSWKTVMMQEFLKELADLDVWDFAIVWISINDLARQSKKSFENNLQGSKLFFSELSDIQDKTLRQNEILFINWESLKQKDSKTWKWKVLAMKDNERKENLPTYLENAHNEWRKIILVVDESHTALDTQKAQDLILNYIQPTIQIEVSATPDSANYRAMIEVPIDSVIKEWMIKKEILINEKIKEFKSDDLWTDEIIIKAALEKQKQLKELYEWQWSQVYPLLLIQLPSEKKTTEAIDQTKLERTQKILKEQFDISLENQKLAVWLSNDKTNKDLIDIKDSPVEVLIFKQAIATWWDCPRAQILVMFREIKKITFEIQTVWRILRMPEWKHYEEEILNKAYVFTDLPKQMIGIHETAKNLIKNQYSFRNELYRPFRLESFFKSRIDYQDIWSSFRTFVAESLVEKVWWEYSEFARENNKKKLWEKINIENVEYSDEIINNWQMKFGSHVMITENWVNRKTLVSLDDYTNEQIFIENTVKTPTQDELIQMSFEDFARNNVREQFTNIARSYKPIMEALYSSLDHFFFGEWKLRSYYQKLILNNQDFFIDVLNKAKDNYLPIKKLQIEQKFKFNEQEYIWSIPQMDTFNDSAKEFQYQKNVMIPCILSFDSQQEKDFIENVLETRDDIVFWYKNWISSKDYFAIPYEEDWEKHCFYPDFIVYFNNWTIWIFDTKQWFTLKEWKGKAKWLEEYISSHKDIKLIWWLIKQQNSTFYVNNKRDFNVKNSEDFDLLSEYININK